MLQRVILHIPQGSSKILSLGHSLLMVFLEPSGMLEPSALLRTKIRPYFRTLRKVIIAVLTTGTWSLIAGAVTIAHATRRELDLFVKLASRVVADQRARYYPSGVGVKARSGEKRPIEWRVAPSMARSARISPTTLANL